ncbi:MAG: hypothetical protein ACK41D_03955 [Rubricoccaceae bacterium]
MADFLLIALQIADPPLTDHVTNLRWLPIASVIVPVILLVVIWIVGSRRAV